MSFSPGSDACRPDDIQMELGTGHDEELREKLADSLSVRLQMQQSSKIAVTVLVPAKSESAASGSK